MKLIVAGRELSGRDVAFAGGLGLAGVGVAVLFGVGGLLVAAGLSAAAAARFLEVSPPCSSKTSD